MPHLREPKIDENTMSGRRVEEEITAMNPLITTGE